MESARIERQCVYENGIGPWRQPHMRNQFKERLESAGPLNCTKGNLTVVAMLFICLGAFDFSCMAFNTQLGAFALTLHCCLYDGRIVLCSEHLDTRGKRLQTSAIQGCCQRMMNETSERKCAVIVRCDMDRFLNNTPTISRLFPKPRSR